MEDLLFFWFLKTVNPAWHSNVIYDKYPAFIIQAFIIQAIVQITCLINQM